LLQRSRQRADQFRARFNNDIGRGDDGELDLAARDWANDERTAGNGLELWLHLGRDTETLQQTFEIDPTRALQGHRNRRRVEQRTLEGFHRADVRLGRAFLDGDRDGHPGDLGARSGGDPALFEETVDHRGPDERHIESFARVEPLDQIAGTGIAHINPVTGVALETRTDHIEGFLERRNAQNPDLGSARGVAEREQERHAGSERDDGRRTAHLPGCPWIVRGMIHTLSLARKREITLRPGQHFGAGLATHRRAA